MADFGLIGRHLGHSHSPMLHKLLGGYDYELIELEPDELEGYFAKRSFLGINVTVPYKKSVIPYCDELSDVAKRIGSVNTVVNRGGRLIGCNTDYLGFCKAIEKADIDVGGKKCLVLGNGGVSPTVRTALFDLGARSVVTVSRSGDNNYVNLVNHHDAEIIINATPVGMFPENGRCLIDPIDFPYCSGVFDLIYNPLRTKLICRAEELGIPSSGGLYMLAAQAAAAVELMKGTKITDSEIDEAYDKLLKSVRSIVLIGMPGCGKSTTAKELCKLAGRRLCDCDDEIIKRCKCSIHEYFERHGEDDFRRLETETLVDITKNVGCVIATGGGVVTRSENLDLLRQNGVVVFLDRGIEGLPIDGRPISQNTSLEALAAVRLPIYKAWSEFTVNANSEAEAAIIIKEALL